MEVWACEQGQRESATAIGSVFAAEAPAAVFGCELLCVALVALLTKQELVLLSLLGRAHELQSLWRKDAALRITQDLAKQQSATSPLEEYEFWYQPKGCGAEAYERQVCCFCSREIFPARQQSHWTTGD